jgi:hypothetical protein
MRCRKKNESHGREVSECQVGMEFPAPLILKRESISSPGAAV